MAYVVMIVISSIPILLGFAALKQITEAQPRAVTAPCRRSRSVEAGIEFPPPRD